MRWSVVKAREVRKVGGERGKGWEVWSSGCILDIGRPQTSR